MSNKDTIDEGTGGYREGKPVEEIARKIKNLKEKKMSNQGMSGTDGSPTDGKKNARKKLEEELEGNLQGATRVLSLAHVIGDLLFGVRLVKEKAKESESPPGGIFNKAKDMALKTKCRLGEAWDELNKISKELK